MLVDRVVAMDDGRITVECAPADLADRLGIRAWLHIVLRNRTSGRRRRDLSGGGIRREAEQQGGPRRGIGPGQGRRDLRAPTGRGSRSKTSRCGDDSDGRLEPRCERGPSHASSSAIAQKELREAVRSKWFWLWAGAFAVLAAALAFVVLPGSQVAGFGRFGRTAASLVALVQIIVPLMGLTLGAQSLAGQKESGALRYLLSHPVSRTEAYWGTYLGLAAALFATARGGIRGRRRRHRAPRRRGRRLGLPPHCSPLLGSGDRHARDRHVDQHVHPPRRCGPRHCHLRLAGTRLSRRSRA